MILDAPLTLAPSATYQIKHLVNLNRPNKPQQAINIQLIDLTGAKGLDTNSKAHCT